MKRKSKRGGRRDGAGRPRTAERTAVISVRLRERTELPRLLRHGGTATEALRSVLRAAEVVD